MLKSQQDVPLPPVLLIRTFVFDLFFFRMIHPKDSWKEAQREFDSKSAESLTQFSSALNNLLCLEKRTGFFLRLIQ